MSNADIDTGLNGLVLIANHYGIVTNLDKLINDFNLSNNASHYELARIAEEIGLYSKYKKKESLENLKRYQKPLMCKMNNDEYIILIDINEKEVLFYDLKLEQHLELSLEEFLNVWSKEIIVFKLRQNRNEEEKFSFWWFIKPLLKFKKALIEIFTSIFLIQLLGMVSPMIIQLIIDKVVVHSAKNTLNVMIIILTVIMIFEAILNLSKTYIFRNITSKLDILMGMKIYKRLMKLPLGYFESRRAGDILSRVREVENVRNFITDGPLTAVLDILFLFIYMGVMVYYSPVLASLIFVSLILYAILSLVAIPIFTKLLDEMYERGADENSYLLESVSGVQTVKALALEGKKQRKWEQILSTYVKSRLDISLFNKMIDEICDIIKNGFDLAVLYVGVLQVFKGNLTIGALIAFRMLSGNVVNPVLKLVGMWQEFNQMKISVEKIGDIFNTPSETSTGNVNMESIDGKIKFEGVFFKYGYDKPYVVKNMTFEIPKGKIIGIVGKSGSGKSTISKLVQRLYIPEKGSIYIDDYDISTIDPNSLRKNIGVVLQENFLFRGSIKENIEINKVNATMEDIINSCKLAGAHDFIMDLPDKYDTLIGENGVGLSGGQRQRIAIARALIRNPKILIFDEATSALDYESESIINKNLKEICKDKTVLIIAHRLSTLKDADEIMVVEKGEVVEFDTHENLLKEQGIYHYLYSMQQRGE
ncbi:MAG: type I secretion system permease/ATPase [Fusobacteriaceae bacterium]|nr:type I secretion system permease/ATPase [Fusobacteriaceae bacterium]